MYCENCNVEFSEGLRYCKWCGQTLVERRRVTSELHSCPSCAAAVQPSWAYCKACGTRLGAAAEPVAGPACPKCGAATDANSSRCLRCGEDLTRGLGSEAEAKNSPATSVIVGCPSCGERVDTGSLYCKICGSAVYSESTSQPQPLPFGASSWLCKSCNSYSPIGSKTCRVCGALFESAGQPPSQAAPEVTPTPAKTSSTLPDLSERLAAKDQPDLGVRTREMRSIETESEKYSEDPTKVFNEKDSNELIELSSAMAPEDDTAEASEIPRIGIETTLLPGVSVADQQQPTSIIQRSRITSPVDDGPEEIYGEANASGQLDSEPADTPHRISESLPPPADAIERERDDASQGPAAVTKIGIPARLPLVTEAGDQPAQQKGGTAQFGGARESKQPEAEATPIEPVRGGTVIIGSGSPMPAGFTPADSEPSVKQEPPAPLSDKTKAARDDVHTAPFGDSFPRVDVSQTTEYQAGSNVRQTGGVVEPPQTRTLGHEPALAGATPPAQDWMRPTGSFDQAAPPQAIVGQAAPPSTVAAQPPKGKSAGLIIALAAGLVVMAVVAFFIWRSLSGGEKPAPSAQVQTPPAPPATQPAAPPTTPATPVAPEGMVLIPAGTYIIGRDDVVASGPDDDAEIVKPKHTVTLPAFFIDQTEVTNTAYKKFIDATGHKAPDDWEGGSYPAGRDNWPVIGISWQDAADYAQWAGKRLPTESEWEAAARGLGGRLYPWGDEWRTDTANVKPANIGSITDVGQYKIGATPEGVLDMIGNVWEWTADEFKLYPGYSGKPPSKIKPGVTFRVIRGGAYDADQRINAAFRGYLDGSQTYPRVGFRCAKDAK